MASLLVVALLAVSLAGMVSARSFAHPQMKGNGHKLHKSVDVENYLEDPSVGCSHLGDYCMYVYNGTHDTCLCPPAPSATPPCPLVCSSRTKHGLCTCVYPKFLPAVIPLPPVEDRCRSLGQDRNFCMYAIYQRNCVCAPFNHKCPQPTCTNTTGFCVCPLPSTILPSTDTMANAIPRCDSLAAFCFFNTLTETCSCSPNVLKLCPATCTQKVAGGVCDCPLPDHVLPGPTGPSPNTFCASLGPLCFYEIYNNVCSCEKDPTTKLCPTTCTDVNGVCKCPVPHDVSGL